MKHPIAVVIPARFDASRLPGKPLLTLGDKPMIQHVYERASLAQAGPVLVATDDLRIFNAVQAFGGRAVMTARQHPSGTDRVAEAARTLDAEIIVNVQGDEPLLDPELILLVSSPLRQEPTTVMSTVAHPISFGAQTSAWGHPGHDLDGALDPNVVKVVCDRQGFALYFSRLPIPFERDRGIVKQTGDPPPSPLLRHVGLYAYRADFLQTFTQLPPTELEQKERLEQLRALEHGYRIRVVITPHTINGGVDTPADLQRARALLGVTERFVGLCPTPHQGSALDPPGG